MMKKIGFILVIIWILIIFLFSGEKAKRSNYTSDKVIIEFIKVKDKLMRSNTNQQELRRIIKENRIYVRKTAHMCEYFILAILVFNFIKYLVIKKIYFISFIVCLILSVFDEIHQLFVPGRTGRLFDVGVDSIGIILGILLCYLINYINEKKIVDC